MVGFKKKLAKSEKTLHFAFRDYQKGSWKKKKKHTIIGKHVFLSH